MHFFLRSSSSSSPLKKQHSRTVSGNSPDCKETDMQPTTNTGTPPAEQTVTVYGCEESSAEDAR